MKTAVKSTVGVLAADALETCMHKVEQYETAVVKHKDPEDLHQMRVQLRRLRTAMQVFAPSLKLPKRAQELQVAKVARRLGRARDLDVIGISLQEHFAPDLPEPERALLKPIQHYLTKQQKKAHKRVKHELRGDRYRRLKATLYKWAASPDCNATARLSIDAVLPDLMMPLVSRLWLHPGWLVGTKVTRGTFKPNPRLNTEMVEAIVADQGNALHSLRKQVKRVRYQLKFVSEHYGDRLDADLDRLADLQDVLGALQDGLVLEAFLTDASPHWQVKLPTLKSLLVDRRHRVWQQWQTHQTYFLAPQHRADLRQRLLTPGSAPAKSTTDNATAKSAKTTAKKPSNKSSSNRSTRSQSTTRKSSRSKSTSTTPDADSDQNGSRSGP